MQNVPGRWSQPRDPPVYARSRHQSIKRTLIRPHPHASPSFRPVVIADEAVLRALKNPTFIDVRGPGEVEAKPGPVGALNVTWDTSTCMFFDPSLLPADKTNPVVVF